MPQIDCPEKWQGVPQLENVRKAASVSQYIASLVHGAAVHSPDPAYSLISKTLQYKSTIVERYSKVVDLPPTAGVPFHLKCLNSPEDMGQAIYDACENRPLVVAMNPQNTGLIVCSHFHKLRDESFQPDPIACPPVNDNVFGKPKIEILEYKAWTLFFTIFRKSNLDLDLTTVDINHVLRWGDDKAMGDIFSYLSFAQCESAFLLFCVVSW